MHRFILFLAVAGFWSFAESRLAAQPAVDRLEKQVRKEVEAAGPPASPATGPAKPEKQPAKPLTPKPPVERGYLGALTDDREDRGRGVRVLKVTPGSPADKAGLKAGDLVTGLGGVRVREMEDFAAIMEEVTPGMTLTFEILRGQERPKLDVTFGPRPARRPPAATSPGAEPAAEPTAEPLLPAPPAGMPPASAKPPDAAPPAGDRVRIEALEQKIRQLEGRIEQLERALQDKKKPE